MSRVAVFVDAGYLFAQGSVALVGEKQRRPDVRVNTAAVLAELAAVVQARCPNAHLLRTYWYDAPPRTGMSAEHVALALTDYVKLRLGVLNGQGQQKGVDSLIVTDLIELARNKSICDAVLLSGDEDVRIGVQIAQSFGVGVHLIGIHPARGSQSQLLRQEADSTTEWDRDILARFMTVRAPRQPTPPPIDGERASAETPDTGSINHLIDVTVSALDTADLAKIDAYWSGGARGIPSDIDRPLLGKCRDLLGRELATEERRAARTYFTTAAKMLIAKLPA